MSHRTEFLSGQSGAGNARYWVERIDWKNGRYFDVPTTRWRALADYSVANARQYLTEQSTPNTTLYAVDQSGMGSVGAIHEYFLDAAVGTRLPIEIARASVLDGYFADTPDAASVVGGVRSELLGSVGGTYHAVYRNRAQSTIWKQISTTWAASATYDESKIALSATTYYDNVFAATTAGMGTQGRVYRYFYGASGTPIYGEQVSIVGGALSEDATIGAGSTPWTFEAFRIAAPTSADARRQISESIDGQATIVAGARPTFLARLVDSAGALVDPTALTSATYNVTEQKAGDPAWNKVVDGQRNKTLADPILGVLQQDYLWGRLDNWGYNVRFSLSPTDSEPFATALRRYVVDVVFQPTSNRDPVTLRFNLNTV